MNFCYGVSDGTKNNYMGAVIHFICDVSIMRRESRIDLANYCVCYSCDLPISSERVSCVNECSEGIWVSNENLDYVFEILAKESALERSRQKDTTRKDAMMLVAGFYKKSDVAAILEAQNHKCYYCSETLTLSSDTHKDHVVPIASGGSQWPSNIVLACSSCNQKKGGDDQRRLWRELSAQKGAAWLERQKQICKGVIKTKARLTKSRKLDLQVACNSLASSLNDKIDELRKAENTALPENERITIAHDENGIHITYVNVAIQFPPSAHRKIISNKWITKDVENLLNSLLNLESMSGSF